MKIWARERYFVRINDVPQEAIDALEKKYTFHFFEERACEQCEWVGLRRQQGLLGECEACAAYRGSALLANKVKIKENQYLATPLGDFEGLCKILKRYVKEDIKKVEKHPIIPIKPIKFMGEPRGYQEEAVASCIRGEKGVLYAPPRSGKCVSGNSMIMTPQGLLPIKDLFPHHIPEEYTDFRSTKIATRFGPRITQGFYAKMVDQTIRITDSNGYVIEGTLNHKILIQDQNLNQVWRKLEDLHVGDVIVHSRKQQWLCRKTPSIPRVNPQRMQRVLYTPRKMTVELAELLGFWVANGNLRRETLNISTYSRRIQQRITECLDKIFPDLHYRVEHDGIYISSSYLSNWLAQPAVGLCPCRSAQKEIPNIILRSDKKYVDAFLRAYLSCDSWIHAQGMELCSASAKLIYQLQVLLSFYGVRCRRKRVLNFARNGTRIKRPYFKLMITSDVHNLAFLNLYKEWKVNANKNQTDVIYYGYDVLSAFHKKHVVYVGKNRHRYYQFGKKILPATIDTLVHKQLARAKDFRYSDMQVISAHRINFQTLKRMDAECCRRFKEALDPDYFYTKVTSIFVINKPRVVYDLCVAKCHEYLVNSIVSHNTVMLTNLIANLSVKSLIIASQRDWLMGFYETFVGSQTQKPLTNIEKSRIGFCKKLADFDKYDICLATVQTFHSEAGQVLLKKLRDKFTLVGIDEVHTSSANKYIQEISRFNCKYKIGLTGTPDRKDGKYVLTEAVVGPVLYEAKVERLRPTVRCVRTHFSDGSKSSIWAYIVRKIESNQKRMELIADWVLKDVEAGHMIVIPLSQTKPILKLIDIINEKAGKKLAYPFYGALKKEVRDDTIQKAREYKIKVIVGNTRLLSTGINIPRCSCIFDVTPSANIPMAIQRFSRILTPCEGKPTPLIRYFLDDIDVRRACLRKEFYNVVIKQLHAMIDEKTKAIMDGYLKERSNYSSSFY